MRRCAWIGALASVLLIAPASASSAGGWDSLNVPKDHYLVGDVASTTHLFYAARLRGAGGLEGGPYFAYLLPPGAKGSTGLGMIDPPNIPAGAVRLGTLAVSGPIDREGYEGPYGRGTLTFTVPDVATGRYAIGFCDDPCRHGSVGWLAWASITIVHTEEEARLLAALDRRAGEMRQLRSKLRRVERMRVDLEDRISSLRADLHDRTMALRATGTRLVRARAQPTSGTPRVAWWEVALLAFALVTAAIVVRRRRVRHVWIPDTVPEGLVEKEPAGT